MFAIYFSPPPAVSCSRNILVFQSFAEEANRCRSMICMQSQRLAGLGVGCLVVDPYGTGDSAGEFSELTWRSWRDDMLTGFRWLQNQPGGCDSFWGVRAGGLMAVDLIADLEEVRSLLFWNPVISGKLFLTQFLRLKLAANLGRPPNGLSTSTVLEQMRQARTMNVAGYDVCTELASGFEEAAFPAPGSLAFRDVAWLEVVSRKEQTAARSSLAYFEALRAASSTAKLQTVVGQLFWQVHERAEAPLLLEATESCIREWR